MGSLPLSAMGVAFLLWSLEIPQISEGQSGEGVALPVAPNRAVMGRKDGVARPAAAGEDTARLDDDALCAALAH